MEFEFKIHTLNVGQADAQFVEIKKGGETEKLILIDCGKNHNDGNLINSYYKKNFKLKGNEFKKIDILIITHWDKDHWGGIKPLINKRTKTVKYSQLHNSLLEFSGMKTYFVDRKENKYLPNATAFGNLKGTLLKKQEEVEENIVLHDGKFRIILSFHAAYDTDVVKKFKDWNPKKKPMLTYSDSPKNLSSIACLFLVVDKADKPVFTYYTAGDLPSKHEDGLVSKENFPIDIFKVSHHGSKDSSSKPFVESIDPKIALISHGNHKGHKHPHKEALERIGNKTTILTTNPYIILTDDKRKEYISSAYDSDMCCNSNLFGEEEEVEISKRKRVLNSEPSDYSHFKGGANIITTFRESRSNEKPKFTTETFGLQFSFNLHSSGKIANNTPKKNWISKRKDRGSNEYKGSEDNAGALFGKFGEKVTDTRFANLKIDGFSIRELNYSDRDSVITGKISDDSEAELFKLTGNLLSISYSYNKGVRLVNIIPDSYTGYLPAIISEYHIPEAALKCYDSRIFDLESGALTQREAVLDFEGKSIEIPELIKLDSIKARILTKRSTLEWKVDSLLFYSKLAFLKLNKTLNCVWSVDHNKDVNIRINSSQPEGIVSLKDLAKSIGLGDIFADDKLQTQFNFSIQDITMGLSLDEKNIKSIGFSAIIDNLLPSVSFSTSYHYSFSTKYYRFGLQIIEDLSIKELLSKAGVSEVHLKQLSFLDDIIITDFFLEIAPDEKTIAIELALTDEKHNTFTIFEDYKVQIDAISLQIGISENKNYDIVFEIDGEIKNAKESSCYSKIGIGYSKESGFWFNVSAYELEVLSFFNLELPDFFDAKANEPIIVREATFEYRSKSISFDVKVEGVNLSSRQLEAASSLSITQLAYKDKKILLAGGLNYLNTVSTFTIDNDHLAITFAEIKFENILQHFCPIGESTSKFAFIVKDLSINIDWREQTFKILTKFDKFQLFEDFLTFSENELKLEKNRDSIALSIITKLIIKDKEIKIKKAALEFSNKGCALSAESEGKIPLPGIDGCSLIDPAIALSISPSGAGFGIYGMLKTTEFLGNAIIYINPSIPSETLVALNFNGMDLTKMIHNVIGVKENEKGIIPGELSLMPIPISFETPEADFKEVIKKDLMIGSTDIEEKSFENKTIGFEKQYFYLYEKVSDTSYFKYVHLYACTTTTGIRIFSRDYKAGIAISGLLTLFNQSVKIDIFAIKGKGIKAEVIFDQPINLGNGIIKLERSSKAPSETNLGPYLSLLTYSEKAHFKLSAALSILDLIRVDTYIDIDREHVYINAEAQLFTYGLYLEIKSAYSDFSNTSFNFMLRFKSEGFSGLAKSFQEKSKQLAQSINDFAKDQQAKVNNQKNQITDYERQIRSFEMDIDSDRAKINGLKSISYEWWEVHRPIIIGAEIIYYEGKIFTQWVLMNGVVGLLKLAKKLMSLYNELLQFGANVINLAIETLNKLAEMIANSIDWIFTLKEIIAKANFEKKGETTSLQLETKIKYRLLGEDFKKEFNIKLNNNGNDKFLQAEISKTIQSEIDKKKRDMEKAKELEDKKKAGIKGVRQKKHKKLFIKFSNEEEENSRQIQDFLNDKAWKELNGIYKDFDSEQAYRSVEYLNAFTEEFGKNAFDFSADEVGFRFDLLHENYQSVENNILQLDHEKEVLDEVQQNLEKIKQEVRDGSKQVRFTGKSKQGEHKKLIKDLDAIILNSADILKEKRKDRKINRFRDRSATDKVNLTYTASRYRTNKNGYIADTDFGTQEQRELLDELVIIYKKNRESSKDPFTDYMDSILALQIGNGYDQFYKEKKDPIFLKNSKYYFNQALILCERHYPKKSTQYKELKHKIKEIQKIK